MLLKETPLIFQAFNVLHQVTNLSYLILHQWSQIAIILFPGYALKVFFLQIQDGINALNFKFVEVFVESFSGSTCHTSFRRCTTSSLFCSLRVYLLVSRLDRVSEGILNYSIKSKVYKVIETNLKMQTCDQTKLKFLNVILTERPPK